MYHTINLNIDKSWNDKQPTAVNNNIGPNALIKKHFFRVQDYAISDPKIVTYYLVMSQQGAVAEAEQPMMTAAIVFCWHSSLLHTSQ